MGEELVEFYGISTLERYLMLNPIYIYIYIYTQFIKKQFAYNL